MPRSLPTTLKVLLVFPVVFPAAISLTVLSTTVYKQPWDCEDHSPRCATEFCRGKCEFGVQTAGFPFTALRDVVDSSPTGGFGKIDRSDWQNGGLEIGCFLLNTLIYGCLLYALVFGISYIGKRLKSRL
jgi:hypothetical protein